MELQTKYSIGDVVYVVYVVYVTTEMRQRDCPDCLNTKLWSATSPGGGEYTFACPRCSGGGYSRRGNDLWYKVHVPLVSKLTVGMVTASTHDHFGDKSGGNVEYMCNETGIGGGSIYHEHRLHPTEEEARAAALIMATAADQETPYVVRLFNDSLRVKDYQFNIIGFEERKLRDGELLEKARALNYAVDDAVSHMKESNPDGYDVKYAVEYLRKGLAKFTGEEVGGVSPDDATDEAK